MQFRKKTPKLFSKDLFFHSLIDGSYNWYGGGDLHVDQKSP